MADGWQCLHQSAAVPWPVAVLGDRASAGYGDGVLRVELPKATPGKPKAATIRVD